MPELQILISTYGRDALKKIAALPHPRMRGVEYLVGWQGHDDAAVPEELQSRDDFRILRLDSVGLSNSRNAMMEEATAPLAAVSDDDLAYTEQHLLNIIESFRDHPEMDFIAFRYASDVCPKNYPEESFDLSRPPRGYFVTSMELVLNLGRIRRKGKMACVWFNKAFGVNGTTFGSGEEDILITRMLRGGLRGVYLPLDICLNTESTTSDRIRGSRGFVETLGACHLYINPKSWPLRMVSHALRQRGIPAWRFCRWWIAGVGKARHNDVFADE